MTDIASSSIAFCLVLFMVCLLLVVLFFCEFGRNRGEMTKYSSSNVLTLVILNESYKSKLMTRSEVPWPLRETSWKNNNETVTRKCTTDRECRNCSIDISDGNASEISQPDRIYTSS